MSGPVLVGASGLVGRRLVRAWRSLGVDVVTVSRQGGHDCRWSMAEAPPPLPAARDRSVFVLAGATPAGSAALSDNARIAQTGVDAARRWGAAHLFVVSSSAVYGETDTPAVEVPEPQPLNAYGQAKLEMERQTRANDVTALRLANVAGASQPFLALKASEQRMQLDRFSDGKGPSRSYIGPVLLARVLAALAERVAVGTPMPPVLNVASASPVAMADIFAAADRPFDWREAGPGAMRRVHLDTAQLAALVPLPAQDAVELLAEARRTEE